MLAVHVTALEAGALRTNLDTFETGLTEDPNASTVSIVHAVEYGRTTEASHDDIAAGFAVTVDPRCVSACTAPDAGVAKEVVNSAACAWAAHWAGVLIAPRARGSDWVDANGSGIRCKTERDVTFVACN